MTAKAGIINKEETTIQEIEASANEPKMPHTIPITQATIPVEILNLQSGISESLINGAKIVATAPIPENTKQRIHKATLSKPNIIFTFYFLFFLLTNISIP